MKMFKKGRRTLGRRDSTREQTRKESCSKLHFHIVSLRNVSHSSAHKISQEFHFHPRITCRSGVGGYMHSANVLSGRVVEVQLRTILQRCKLTHIVPRQTTRQWLAFHSRLLGIVVNAVEAHFLCIGEPKGCAR